ncbi:MAG: hypothetical protein AAFV53_38170, partial [Myxococcota bacterium]
MERSPETQRLEELIDAALVIERGAVVRAVRFPATLLQALELGRIIGLEVAIGALDRYRWMGGIRDLFWAAAAEDDTADQAARLLVVQLIRHVFHDRPSVLAEIAGPLAQIRAVAMGTRRPFNDRRDRAYGRCLRAGIALKVEGGRLGRGLADLQLRVVPYSDVLRHLHIDQADEWWHRQVLQQVRAFLMGAPVDDARVKMIAAIRASVILRGDVVDEVIDPARLRQVVELGNILGPATLIGALMGFHWPHCAYDLLLAVTDDRQRAGALARDFAADCVAHLPA